MEPDVQAANDAPEKKEPEKKEPGLEDFLKEFPNSPSKDQIEDWKQLFGEVLCSGFSETELYIWRPINRLEYIKLQTELASKEGANQYDFEEMVIGECVLWSSPIGGESLLKKAGTLSSLHEQIMQNSNFVNPAMASALVIKL